MDPISFEMTEGGSVDLMVQSDEVVLKITDDSGDQISLHFDMLEAIKIQDFLTKFIQNLV